MKTDEPHNWPMAWVAKKIPHLLPKVVGSLMACFGGMSIPFAVSKKDWFMLTYWILLCLMGIFMTAFFSSSGFVRVRLKWLQSRHQHLWRHIQAK